MLVLIETWKDEGGQTKDSRATRSPPPHAAHQTQAAACEKQGQSSKLLSFLQEKAA
jgi:hypothetical protein